MKRILLLCTAVLLAGSGVRAAENAAFQAALLSIDADELGRHVDVLADDTFEGREAGSRGGRAAGVYLYKQLARLKLKPAGDGRSYFQQFQGDHRNILALIEGSDAKLKDEVVLVSAHYDHVGYGSSSNSYGPVGYIHNGADDNASGVAGLLEIAEAFSQLQQPPRRTILFALWDGEEKGLLGSRHWLADPTIAAARVKMLINMDMIGRLRNGKIEMIGTRTARGLRRLVAERAGDSRLSIDFTWEIDDNSDHWPFYERGVPLLMPHTRLHDDYHRPSDDAHKLSHEGMQQIARLMFRIVHSLANRETLPPFRSAVRRESILARYHLERPAQPLPPRLGVTWDEQPDEPGIVLNRIVPGSAADRAGLATGDRLMAVGRTEIASGPRFRAVIASAPKQTTLQVIRRDKQEPEEIEIELAGNPVRIGIAWREDPAEPGVALLSRVVPGTPADQAGLRVGDRIYQVGGESRPSAAELVSRLAEADGAIELRVEHDGRLRTVEIDLPPTRP